MYVISIYYNFQFSFCHRDSNALQLEQNPQTMHETVIMSNKLKVKALLQISLSVQIMLQQGKRKEVKQCFFVPALDVLKTSKIVRKR